jgi:hypothetical protein
MHTHHHTHTCFPQVFVAVHQSVERTSAKMATAIKRKTYVTPTNYLETVSRFSLIPITSQPRCDFLACDMRAIWLHTLAQTPTACVVAPSIWGRFQRLGFCARDGPVVRCAAMWAC